MKYSFFQIPVTSPESAAEELNQFLDSHRIVDVEKHFHAGPATAFWSFCVTWLPGSNGSKSKSKSAKIDYKAVLSDEQFQVFSRLRDVRKRLAEVDGVPVYAIATNEQLADMIRQSVTSKTALGKIAGFGQAKVDRHGDEFLAVLAANVLAESPAEGTSSAKTNEG